MQIQRRPDKPQGSVPGCCQSGCFPNEETLRRRVPVVRQYDYNGTRSYTIFRYQSSGEMEELTHLFTWEELIPEDSTEPCPYYEIDGTEVEKTEFEEQLAELVIDRMLKSTAWTAL